MTKNNQQFDSIKCPLRGVNIIEAGAGTGKTYNIQNLYARMIVEKGYKVDSILVVTFTESATKELKDRIRSILIQIQRYYATNDDTEIEERVKLIADIPQEVHANKVGASSLNLNVNDKNANCNLAEYNNADIELKKKRIDSALRNFDTASIFTIHGFCNRLLNDFSFESSILFNLELETNPDAIVQDIIEDFWRIENYSSNDILITALLVANKISVESLKKFVQACISQPNIELEPKINLDKEIKAFKTAFERLKNIFNKNEIIDILSSDYLNQTRYKPKQVSDAADNINVFLKGIINDNIFKSLEKFTTESIKSAINKKGKEALFQVPDHPVFLTCHQLVDLKHVVKLYSSLIKTKCKNYFFKEYAKRKQQLNIQTFDDLLNKVNEIVDQKDSRLKKAAVIKFNAAMIDEFQDTDSVQYNIFKKLFIETGKPVFLVGDPKQAIYAFRGGDIFTYQKAKDENVSIDVCSSESNAPNLGLEENEIKKQNPALVKTGKLFSLTTNWRSADNMVDAVNSIFTPNSISTLPFADKKIKYQKAHSSKNKNELLFNNKIDNKPFKLILAEGEFNKTQLETNCCKITSNLIYNLLQSGEITIKNGNTHQKAQPKDIAILVSSHIQARMIKEALGEYNIPSVLQATGSVFDTDEAEQFEYILKAIANPNNASLIKGALLTDILGYKPNKITEMSSSENQDNILLYEDILESFKELNDICINKSFIEMYNTLTAVFKVKNTLLKQIDGERKLTNLIHISELLHDCEMDSKLGLTGLISWLEKQRNKGTREDKDEFEIRLETDNKAVKVMTVHKSKGLEFPIVFCPFLWKIYAIPHDEKKIICKYHKSGKAVLNLDNNEDALGNYCDEKLQELIRIFYVAATRAKYQYYLIWGNIRKSKNSDIPTSALDYIFKFEDPQNIAKGKIAATLSEFGFIPPIIKNTDYISVSTIDPDALESATYTPESNTDEQALAHKEFDSELIDHSWKITSFSGLAPHETKIETLFSTNKDYDETDNKPETKNGLAAEPETSIFNFQAGAKTGTCWHSIFENLNFTSDDKTIKAAVNEILKEYNLDESENEEMTQEKCECVFNMTKNVLNTNLPSLNNIKLSDITNNNMLSEMEFNFKLNDGLKTENLSEALLEYTKTFGIKKKITNWHDKVINGYMTGFIDLIFRHDDKYYILDWKSNRLDETPEGFCQDGLKKEIAKNYYFLQYLIYTVALDKYLTQTILDYDYNTHFGGIYYIFLRGVDNNTSSDRGVFYDRPNKTLITELAEVLS